MNRQAAWFVFVGVVLVAFPPSLRAEGDPSTEVALNRVWILLCGFLMFAMQAGFALTATGLTRAKNVAHTISMNVVIYALATIAFWVCGFALMFGNAGPLAHLGATEALASEATATLGGKEFGLFGCRGFFLADVGLDAGILSLFLFQSMFLDAAATIPIGALAERWSFRSFVLYGLFLGALVYPVYGNWSWGNGWLARLGANFGLGHGHVDFAGSSVVHLVGGLTALVGNLVVGPRIGKFRPDGSPNPLPAHNIPMYMLGTLLLVFGWFGFNAGGVHAATDGNIGRVAVNTMLASATGALAAMTTMWVRFGKPDPSFICNGALAGLVAITASCAYVAPWAAACIGSLAGVLVVWSALFLERRVRVDDPVGAISVHGAGGLWGVLALGLFADGTYAPSANFNGVPGKVTGLFYGDASQFVAEIVAALVCILWVVPTTGVFFRVVGRFVGNRVPPSVEVQGLDVTEMGAFGYIANDPKGPEVRPVVLAPTEPRRAVGPPPEGKRFVIIVEGVDLDELTNIWSDLCQKSAEPPPPEFLMIYPHMTTLQGNRFRFRSGDAQQVRRNLERLLQGRIKGRVVRTRLES